MQMAYNSILYQDISFKQITYDVGYENYTSFLDVFMRQYNISPIALRSSARKNKKE